MPFVVGVLLAIAIAALAKFTRFDEDRSFYSTVLVIIASYYVLFTVLDGSSHALVWELGIMAHGLFDLVHDVIIENSGVPSWWPSFCGSLDVLLGLWVITSIRSRLTCPMR